MRCVGVGEATFVPVFALAYPSRIFFQLVFVRRRTSNRTGSYRHTSSVGFDRVSFYGFIIRNSEIKKRRYLSDHIIVSRLTRIGTIIRRTKLTLSEHLGSVNHFSARFRGLVQLADSSISTNEFVGQECSYIPEYAVPGDGNGYGFA